MKSSYPHMVYVGDEKSRRAVRVNTAAEHENRFPEDYVAFQKEIASESLTSESLTVAAREERERCARIAETMSPGNKMGLRIAAAIRKVAEPDEIDLDQGTKPEPPTLELVMSKGYGEERAKQIVAEETAKSSQGIKPYGPNDLSEFVPPAAPTATSEPTKPATDPIVSADKEPTMQEVIA